MVIPSVPKDLATQLNDLTNHGISFSHQEGLCSMCGNQIPRMWSSYTKHLDVRCHPCSQRSLYHPAYSQKTVWVVKVSDHSMVGWHHEAFVKIEGKLYYIQGDGELRKIVDPETGKTVLEHGLTLPWVYLFDWYTQQHTALQW